MARAERLFRIVVLLREHRQLRFADLLDRLEISAPTLKRDLRYLRDRLGTPIRYDAFDRCYRLEESPRASAKREIPGLWLDERELYALAFAWSLLEQVEPGAAVSPVVGALVVRLRTLTARDPDRARLLERVRVVVPGRRPVNEEVFSPIVEALGRRRQVEIDYYTRSRESGGRRRVSAQRLVYRRTWYLDAWCHRVDALRRFALDGIREATPLETGALEVPLERVEQAFDATYGAFGGTPTRRARLRFNARAAQWVINEEWHPAQQLTSLADGSVEVHVPYEHATELVMDILRYGPDVEVLGDTALRRAVRDRVLQMAERYDPAR